MPNIHQELFILTSAEALYGALTTQAGLSAWWTPETEASTEVGSILKFSFGLRYFKKMRIINLKPLKYVEWQCIEGAEEWIGTSILFRIETGTKEEILNTHPEIEGQLLQSNLQDGTVLAFRHDNWRNHTSMYAECNYTWAAFLRSLKLYCETGKGKPWPTQHQGIL
jgi:hypothetical protein